MKLDGVKTFLTKTSPSLTKM